MNIYLLTQHDVTGYDTYDSCVVLAESEDEAKIIHPAYYEDFGENRRSWTDNKDNVNVTFLGEYAGEYVDDDVVCASFNAG